ncbi:Bbp16 family capsid cement protein [Magnetococcus sp. PR-3]|uniref:Bbp16 family capsid cement protein n=1 Tax=Magnetococcus sp. PR-3 TaxID=3120355 RepID=UPI002FCDEE3E
MTLYCHNSLFSEDQAVTTSGASDNHLNHTHLGDLGHGTPVPLSVQVTEDFTGCTSVQVEVQADDNSSFSSPTTLASSGAVAVAELLAGYRFPLNVMPSGSGQQYLRLYYTVVGTATAGKLTAGITGGNGSR